MTHDLKTDPQHFDAVVNGDKSFEIRLDDRGFNVGDDLRLRKTSFSSAEMRAGKPLVYTGEEQIVHVTYILRGPVYGLAKGWVIMSFL